LLGWDYNACRRQAGDMRRGVRVMPMLFWLPMIFMSAMVELTTPTIALTPKRARVPVKRAA